MDAQTTTTTSWYDNDTHRTLFNSLLIQPLIKRGMIPNGTVTGEQLEDARSRMFVRFEDETGKTLKSFPDAVSAAIALTEFIDTYIEPDPCTILSITVDITYPTPQGAIGLHASAVVNEGFTLDEAYIALTKQVLGAYEKTAKFFPNLRAKVNETVANGVIQPTSSDTIKPTVARSAEETWECVEIRVATKDGKPGYYCVGGRWRPFGVRIWEDQLIKAGFKPSDFVEGSNSIAKMSCKIALKEDGKPQKVLSLTKV